MHYVIVEVIPQNIVLVGINKIILLVLEDCIDYFNLTNPELAPLSNDGNITEMGHSICAMFQNNRQHQGVSSANIQVESSAAITTIRFRFDSYYLKQLLYAIDSEFVTLTDTQNLSFDALINKLLDLNILDF